jgi:fumarate reductase subunit C
MATDRTDPKETPAPLPAREWVRPMPKAWWLTRKTWRVFMLREATCLFVGGYAVFLVVLLARAHASASADATPWRDLVASLSCPSSLVLHALVLGMACFHTATWFIAAPKALRVYRGEERVPERIVVGAHFAAWFLVSALVALLVLA